MQIAFEIFTPTRALQKQRNLETRANTHTTRRDSDEALDWIRQNPGPFLKAIGPALRRFLVPHPDRQSVQRPAVSAQMLVVWALALLSIPGFGCFGDQTATRRASF